jgi:hypothetical protein
MSKWIGLAAGLAAAVVLLSTWQVPATGGTLGADVKLVATPPGELTLKPAGMLLSGSGLVAGGAAATGRLELRNITARKLWVRVRMLPSAADLDRVLRVESEDAGSPVAIGPLGKLRRWSRRRIAIEPGESRRVDVRVFVVRGASDYEGRIVDVTVELRARPVGP